MNKELFQFLSELRLHNNREWFQANKPRYDLLHRQFIEVVQELINRMTLFEPELAGLIPKDCIFRIYRDIRFSPDKTPYKTHFGAYIAAYGAKASMPVTICTLNRVPRCLPAVFGVRLRPC